MQEMPPGAMLAVQLSEDEVLPLLGDDLSIAAVNEPGRPVVSGSLAAIADLERRLPGRRPGGGASTPRTRSTRR